LVEQRPEKPCVAGSIPALSTFCFQEKAIPKAGCVAGSIPALSTFCFQEKAIPKAGCVASSMEFIPTCREPCPLSIFRKKQSQKQECVAG
jgi:hypothetical protein